MKKLPPTEVKFWVSSNSSIYILACICGARYEKYQELVRGNIWACRSCEGKFGVDISIKELND